CVGIELLGDPPLGPVDHRLRNPCGAAQGTVPAPRLGQEELAVEQIPTSGAPPGESCPSFFGSEGEKGVNSAFLSGKKKVLIRLLPTPWPAESMSPVGASIS